MTTQNVVTTKTAALPRNGSLVPAPRRREVFVCTGAELDSIFAFAAACNLGEELFDTVVTKWNEAKKH